MDDYCSSRIDRFYDVSSVSGQSGVFEVGRGYSWFNFVSSFVGDSDSLDSGYSCRVSFISPFSVGNDSFDGVYSLFNFGSS